jgi:ATP-binding protein involved in chromosome partitioning
MKVRTYHELEGQASDLGDQVAWQNERVSQRLKSVRRVVAVMSGKGGVGKSLLTSSLATELVRRGHRVGLLDADLNGPSVAPMVGASAAPLRFGADGILPPVTADGLAVMSMGLLVPDGAAVRWHEPAEASFVWRGTQERGALREFLADVAWGPLDFMLIDLPPGTARLVELHELVPELAGALAVTIPSPASRDAVARSLDLARAREIPVPGLVENLAGYRCEACGSVGRLSGGDAGESLSRDFDVPLLERIPFDPTLDAAAANGTLREWLAGSSRTGRQIGRVADRLEQSLGHPASPTAEELR